MVALLDNDPIRSTAASWSQSVDNPSSIAASVSPAS
jgi:hypothetical protein